MRDATRIRRRRLAGVFVFTLLWTFVAGMLAFHVAVQFDRPLIGGFH